jgi:tagatose 6-phosphate kinase
MIVCLGTTPTVQRTMTFDRLALDEVNRARAVDEYASGKSVNVARVAHLLGADVLELGFAGGDRGDFIRRALSEEGVHHDFVTVGPRSRLCTTVIDSSTGAVTELVEESAEVAARDWLELRAKFTAAVRRAKVCVLSGSLPPGGPPDFYARCAAIARAAGAVTVVDSRGEPFRLAVREAAGTVIVKLNRNELALTLGVPLENADQFRAALRSCVPPAAGALVTMGAAGAVAFDGARAMRIATPKVVALNPIGSGDAVAAGLAVALERGAAFIEACVLGIACGAANAITQRAGYVRPQDVNALLADVRNSVRDL